jgi:hypothetical protein
MIRQHLDRTGEDMWIREERRGRKGLGIQEQDRAGYSRTSRDRDWTGAGEYKMGLDGIEQGDTGQGKHDKGRDRTGKSGTAGLDTV